MASRDGHHNSKTVVALAPQAIAADGAKVGPIIDTAGFESVEFVIASGTLTDGDYTPSFEEGDTANLADTAAVAAGDLIGTIAAATFALADDVKTKKIGYRGTKRYLRLTVTGANIAAGGGLIGAVAVLGHPRSQPQGAA